MFDPPASPSPAVDTAAWVERLARHDGHDLTDVERVNQIRELERLKAAAAAAQARIIEPAWRTWLAELPTVSTPEPRFDATGRRRTTDASASGPRPTR